MTTTNNTQEKIIDTDLKMQSIDLNAWFGAKQALKNVNIGIKTNSVTAIIGPS
jgi:ABC-type phosphate transport system ATPase subunit